MAEYRDMMKPGIVLIFILIAATSPLWAGDHGTRQTLRYTVLSNGRTAGSEVDAYSPGGHVDRTSECNDRGRVPQVRTPYTLAADGLPLRTDVTGNDYLQAPVDEHFALENGSAHWKSSSEEGRAATRCTPLVLDIAPGLAIGSARISDSLLIRCL